MGARGDAIEADNGKRRQYRFNEVTHAGGRQNTQHSVEDAVTGAQDGHEDDLLAVENLRRHFFERGLDGHGAQREIARDFVREKHADLLHERSKLSRTRLLLPHMSHLVCDERVIDDV